MKDKQKKNQRSLKVIAATAMTLFSLLATFTGTISWFNAVRQKNTSTDGFSIDAGSPIKIISCYAVRYDGQYGAIAFDISSGDKSIAMSEYDSIFLDRNVNTPLFLRMELTNFNTKQDLTVTIPCTGNYKTGNTIDPYLSNVICAKFMRGLKVNNNVVVDNNQWSGDNVHNNAVLSSYQGMLANASTNTGTPFVSNGSKTSSISLTLHSEEVFGSEEVSDSEEASDSEETSNPSFIVSREVDGDNVDAVVVFLALDYYYYQSVNLVNEYKDSYNGAEHSHFFESDIGKITIDNSGGAA